MDRCSWAIVMRTALGSGGGSTHFSAPRNSGLEPSHEPPLCTDSMELYPARKPPGSMASAASPKEGRLWPGVLGLMNFPGIYLQDGALWGENNPDFSSTMTRVKSPVS